MRKVPFRKFGGVSILLAVNLICVLPAISACGQVIAWGRNDYSQTNVPVTVSNMTAIAAGAFHDLALQPDGTVLAWGADYEGQIDVPAGLSNVVAVAAGGAHSLALKSDGTVVAWGWDGYNQIDVPTGLSNVVAIAGGWQHSIVLKSDGTVVAWGNPSGGSPGSAVPANLNNVVAIAASYHQNVAVKSDGTVAVWGSDPGLTNVPSDLSNVIAVAAAYDASLALKSDGSLTAWGEGATTTNLPAGLSNVVAIAGGYYNFMALKADGTVTVWGDNANGQTNVPSGLTNVAAIATGYGDCVTLAGSGAPQIVQQPRGMTVLAESPALFVASAFGAAPLSCQWKFNDTNLDGARSASLLLTNLQLSQAGFYSVTVSNAAGSTESQAAALNVLPFTASVLPTNQLLYIGDVLSVTFQGATPNFFQWQFEGAPLPGETNAMLILNQVVTNQPGAYSVVVSNYYGSVTLVPAVVTVTNRAPFFTSQPAGIVVSPWGTAVFQAAANGSKPLTYQWLFNGMDIPGATNATLTVTNVLLSQAGNYSVRINNAVDSFVSSNAYLAVLSVVTWGATNSDGLGIVPSDLTNVLAISAGYHSVALKSNGRVVAWGNNYYGQTNVPAGLSNVVAIAAAYEHTVALKSNGTVVAWGYGGTNVPIGLSNVIAIAAGDYHSLALKTNGTVVAWGDGGYVDTGSTNVPASLSNVVAIAAGAYFSAALRSDGTVVTFGSAPSTNGMTNVVMISASEFPLVALKANGTVVAANVTAPPASLSNVVSVAAGRYHALALKSDGTVTNWAFNNPPTPVGLTNVAVIASGQSHCLAIIGSGPQPAPFVFSSFECRSNKFSVSLPGQYGRIYWLEYKNSLAAANWKTLPLNLAIGNSITLTDGSATNSQRFYRVREW